MSHAAYGTVIRALGGVGSGRGGLCGPWGGVERRGAGPASHPAQTPQFDWQSRKTQGFPDKIMALIVVL